MNRPALGQINLAVAEERAAEGQGDSRGVGSPAEAADVAATEGAIQEVAPAGLAPLGGLVEGRGGDGGGDRALGIDVDSVRRGNLQEGLECLRAPFV